jgi:predicted Fe-Mo cluster-binding NifX family protein
VKAAVPAEGPGLEAAPSAVFGRCPYFVVVDLDTGGCVARPNPSREASSAAGVEAARFVVDLGADVLVTGRLGPHARQVIEAAGIRVLSGLGATVRETVERLRRGELSPLEGPGADARHGKS